VFLKRPLLHIVLCKYSHKRESPSVELWPSTPLLRWFSCRSNGETRKLCSSLPHCPVRKVYSGNCTIWHCGICPDPPNVAAWKGLSWHERHYLKNPNRATVNKKIICTQNYLTDIWDITLGNNNVKQKVKIENQQARSSHEKECSLKCYSVSYFRWIIIFSFDSRKCLGLCVLLLHCPNQKFLQDFTITITFL
jgi:hypothetical protein